MSKSTPISQLPSQQNTQTVSESTQPSQTQIIATQKFTTSESDKVIGKQSIDADLQQLDQQPTTIQYNQKPVAQAGAFIANQSIPPSMIAPVPMVGEIVPSASVLFGLLKIEDIKNTALVMAIVLLICFVPFSEIMSKYVAINKIPYADVLMKVIVAGILFLALSKVI